MMMLVCLVLAFAFAIVFKKPLKKAPWVFYLLTIAFDVVLFYSAQLNLPRWFYSTVIMANGRCLFAFGLFTVVMFIGAMKDGSKLERWLHPIRAELSILAALLALGHMVRYANIYSLRIITNPAAQANGMLVSFVIAILLTIMLVLLTVTSFKFVKHHMKASVWKGLQRLAYPFFVLIYAHVLLIILRPLLTGASGAVESAVVYGAVVLVYVVMRVLRYRQDKAAKLAAKAEKAAEAEKVEAVAEQAPTA